MRNSGVLLMNFSGFPSSSSFCSNDSTAIGLGVLKNIKMQCKTRNKSHVRVYNLVNFPTQVTIITKRETNLPIIKQPLEICLIAACAPGFLANSTIPSPVDFPRSSTITTARSTSPNCVNASSNSSFDTCDGKYFTLRAAP